ncbi:MAG: division/cell wall cluster transcriptional repressor MraZ [Akkermansiaceae bacterium]
MSAKSYSLGGFYPYKMDAKCRVSMPADWRDEIGAETLRLLVSHNEKLPTLKVLTESEFERMQQEVNDSAMTPAKKRAMLGALFERTTKTHVNDQGKLVIPKAQLEHPQLKPGEALVLCGRGDFIEILNEENHQKLCAAREATLAELDEDFGFF